MKQLLTLIIIFMGLQPLLAGPGEITGIIKDSLNNEVLVGANVVVTSNGKFVKGTVTDLEGYYSIILAAGDYEVKFSYTGYNSDIYPMRVSSDQIISLHIQLTPQISETVVINERRKESEYIHRLENVTVIDIDDIENSSLRPLDLIAPITPGIYQADYGEPLIFRGARPGSTLYMVDGMRIIGEPYLPLGATDEMQVITGGMPAKYGDATGGVIVITTKSYNFY